MRKFPSVFAHHSTTPTHVPSVQSPSSRLPSVGAAPNSNNPLHSPHYNWEELRSEARQLESEIDGKLVTLSKLGAAYSHSLASSSSQSHTVAAQHKYDLVSSELDTLLTRLVDVNSKLATFLNDSPSSSSLAHTASRGAGLVHILQRHRDILQDYQQEFVKTRSTINSAREREELMGSVKDDIAAFKSSSGDQNRSFYLMKEHDHAQSSERLLDEQLSLADSVHDSLRAQHAHLRDVNSRVTSVINRFPMINSLVQKITLRQRQDTIILSAVISICLVILLLYMLR